MKEEEIRAWMARVEANSQMAAQNSLLASKSVLNTKEVAVLTGLKVAYIYRLTSTNKIPYYKRGKLVYFDKSEVEAWMKQTRVGTKEEALNTAARYNMQRDQKRKG